MDPLYSYSRNREGCKIKKICVETLSAGAHSQNIALEERPRDSRSAAYLGGTYERQTLSSYFSKKKPDTLEACRVGIQTHIGSLEETMQSTKNYYTKTTFFLMTESNFRYNQRRKLLRVSRSAGS
jgi:hypothetical protein